MSWWLYSVFILYCIIISFPVIYASSDADTFINDSLFAIVLASSTVLDCVSDYGFGSRNHVKRKRRTVRTIFDELGAYYVQRNYRMKEDTFWKLHRELLPFLPCIKRRKK